MITRLLSPSTTSTRFSAERLPEAVHGLVLQEVMAPIIQSESMAPTIQAGDGLELEDATDLRIGDVVVYRLDRLFICHRIHGIDGRRLFLQGDAATGATKRSTFSRSSVGSMVSSAMGSGSMFAGLDYHPWEGRMILHGVWLGRGVRNGQDLSSCGS
ncbi:MAG: S24/S26 family peptidase [Nitrospira sp.]|nr:S24/S26 family peptidase [Nitrospira sp.]MDH5346708.1 S24/S26 family peptidase [Nitrospira sp.]